MLTRRAFAACALCAAGAFLATGTEAGTAGFRRTLLPTGVPHSGTNGPARTVIAATFVVEKGKPLASPA